MKIRALAVASAVAALCSFTPAAASAETGSEPGQAAVGPPLTVAAAELDKALTCTTDLRDATRDPVLLTPAFATDQQSFGWNYLRSLPAAGIPVCSLSFPDEGYGDLQIAAQYVVHAVRTMAADSGRQVVMMGHQHGPLDELWALTFWPDLPALVSDFISLATPYNGTDSARSGCDDAQECPPANWQIATGSKFLTALAARPLPDGPGYTSIYTQFDELIYPQPRASTLAGASNIAVQDICPLRPVEHFGILGDNVAYNIVLDALDHDGPAAQKRISKNLCFTTTMPQLRYTLESSITGFAYGLGVPQHFENDSVDAEPELASYAQ
ncbi:lipase family protein [Rhodococcus sp. ARC_M12]|uniref:lipase family protein n=1 Tax=Rhodococcus sp. ARC_M12 TaxID=2928854 RepID=UPI001FB2F120|nr:lipase family protein [Rhodococcus sp. ARC_M12]MCJ0980233.1 lipase family protein [Rhodococcus sp. ARC_M12]